MRQRDGCPKKGSRTVTGIKSGSFVCGQSMIRGCMLILGCSRGANSFHRHPQFPVPEAVHLGARREGVSEGAVRKRAKAKGWSRVGARCIAVEECGRGRVAHLADGGEIGADIGADGIHSLVRKSLFGPGRLRARSP